MLPAMLTKQEPTNPYLTADRQIKTVTIPEFKALTIDEVFTSGYPKPEVLKRHFLEEGRLDIKTALKIIKDATSAFTAQKNIIELQSPLIICGNINGQFYDLIRIFERVGSPFDYQYLFLGGYVNRGHFGIECVLYLYSMVLWHPMTFNLLRGNHESRHMTSFFTFKKECKLKYSMEVYDAVMTSFDALPIAALINGKYLCVHGGLSPDIPHVSDIMKLDRFVEPPPQGPLCDLLWSDPCVNFGHNLKSVDAFTPNTDRGCSYFFSFRACCEFLHVNQLVSVIRAHQVHEDGFCISRRNVETGFPALITVFSSPNYADAYMNKGAILKFDRHLMITHEFRASAHPYWLPNMSDAFSWSVVFIGEKVTEMLMTVVNLCSVPAADESSASRSDTLVETTKSASTVTPKEELKISTAFRTKIQAIEKLARRFRTLREEHSSSLILKGVTPSTKKPFVEVLGERSLEDLLSKQQAGKPLSFPEAKHYDRINEMLPAYDEFDKFPSTAQ